MQLFQLLQTPLGINKLLQSRHIGRVQLSAALRNSVLHDLIDRLLNRLLA